MPLACWGPGAAQAELPEASAPGSCFAECGGGGEARLHFLARGRFILTVIIPPPLEFAILSTLRNTSISLSRSLGSQICRIYYLMI